MSNERWVYDDERGEVIDCTIPDGRAAAVSAPICRIANGFHMLKNANKLGQRIANLPNVEQQNDRLRAENERLKAALVKIDKITRQFDKNNISKDDAIEQMSDEIICALNPPNA